MALILSQASGFNPGSEMWVLPQFNQSIWLQRLDWYLNFQVNKAFLRERDDLLKALSRPVQEISSECGLKEIQVIAKNQILIPISSYVPSQWLLVIPLASDFESWVAEISLAAASMKTKGLRVFLPSGKTSVDFDLIWNSKNNTSAELALIELSLVNDVN